MQWTKFRRFLGEAKIFDSYCNRRSSSDCRAFIYGNDVEVAKRNGLPIVALESTIITHGMPYPHNLNTAVTVENAVRKKGAVPAIIAILDGRVHVGLSQEQLEVLARSDPIRTVKCSRRDLSAIIAQKLNGGTTVSATILLAHLSGIQVMATGGIGGVHRGAESTFDISNDLVELGRTPVAVVCSGVKSILDIEKTLEYLETQGVPVIKIGETHNFPAFYCTETFDKLKVPHKVSNSEEAANILRIQRELGLKTGLLFAVPIPEQYALDSKEMESAIHKALENAKSKHVTGKGVTPFLLEELNKLTHGQSLQANIALIENNSNMAAEIATHLAKKYQTLPSNSAPKCTLSLELSPVVLGGAVMDTTIQVKDPDIQVREVVSQELY